MMNPIAYLSPDPNNATMMLSVATNYSEFDLQDANIAAQKLRRAQSGSLIE